jgi:tetratricopeptide (TPR) repeat protein
MHTHRLRRAGLLLVVIGIVFVSAPGIASRFMNNLGLIMLNRALVREDTQADPVRTQSDLATAEVWLRRAIALDEGNVGASRGLGFALGGQGQESDALAAWQSAGVTAGEFIQRGQVARAARRDDEALIWFMRAVHLQPDSGDAWYYAGLAYDSRAQWPQARDAYREALAAPTLEQVGISSVYYRLGTNLFQRANPADIDGALQAYKSAVTLDQFGSPIEASDAHFKLGEIYELRGLDARQSLLEFQKAVELNPQHHWAHLRWGHALYQTDHDLAAAEREINQALTLWPDDVSRKWPYRLLGDIYQDADRLSEATAAYQTALRIDPADQYVKTRLDQLIAHDQESGDPTD